MGDVSASGVESRVDVEGVPPDVAVGEHHALRQPGRATGEHEDPEIVEALHGHFGEWLSVPDERAPALPARTLVGSRTGGVVVDQQEPLEAGADPDRIENRSVALLDDRAGRARREQHLLQLGAGQPEVHRHEDRPQPEAAQHRDDERRGVQAQVDNAVAVADPTVGEHRGYSGRAFVQFPVCQVSPVVSDRYVVSEVAGVAGNGGGGVDVDGHVRVPVRPDQRSRVPGGGRRRQVTRSRAPRCRHQPRSPRQ